MGATSRTASSHRRMFHICINFSLHGCGSLNDLVILLQFYQGFEDGRSLRSEAFVNVDFVTSVSTLLTAGLQKFYFEVSTDKLYYDIGWRDGTIIICPFLLEPVCDTYVVFAYGDCGKFLC